MGICKQYGLLPDIFARVTVTVIMVLDAALFTICLCASEVWFPFCGTRKQTTATHRAGRHILLLRAQNATLVSVCFRPFGVFIHSILVKTLFKARPQHSYDSLVLVVWHRLDVSRHLQLNSL